MFLNIIMNYFFLFTYSGGILFLIKRNMNNITHKNAFINTNDLYINSFYNQVLAKIIIFVMNSILKHLRIACSPNFLNSNKNITA